MRHVCRRPEHDGHVQPCGHGCPASARVITGIARLLRSAASTNRSTWNDDYWTVIRLTLAPSALRTPCTRTFTPSFTRLLSAVSMRVTGTPGSTMSSDSPPENLTLMLLLPS